MPERIRYLMEHPWRFLRRVGAGFRRNQGFLLAGAVAYYTLLSIVPAFALLLVVLSHVMEAERLLLTADAYLRVAVPGQSDVVLEQLRVFLENKRLAGGAGLLVLLFFSSMTFTALENAMSVIFYHRVAIRRRHFLVSAVIPYLYMLSVGLGLLLVSLVAGALQSMGTHSLALLGLDWNLGGVAAVLLYLLGFTGQVMLLTSLYMVMPVGHPAWRHALLGGIVAAVSWELTRHFLVWYFAHLSVVNVVYGSLATAIIILISFEIAALIVLFGAQLVAELERLGLPEDRREWRT